jgi:hypothetical protein
LRSLHGLQTLREGFICKSFAAEELLSLGRALPLARGEFVDSFRRAV